MAYVYQQVRDTAAAWTAANPVLPQGILAYETDTLRWKLGDGATAWNSLGYLTICEAAELLTRIKTVDGATSGLDADLLDGQHGSYYATSDHVHRNHLINGDFSIAQRGTSFTGGTTNADDAYTLDRWYILSDGNDIVDVTQNTDSAPTNQLTCIALDVETINKKFGIAQIIEQKNCVGLIGNTVTLSFKAKVSATTKLDNVKAAIVAWSGTADEITSDIISAWGIEGTNPTLIANATYENTPANLNVTTSWATYSITANIDTASTKNVIVLIWSDVTDTTLGDFLYITDVQLEVGSVATSYERRSFGEELTMCQRYYQFIKFIYLRCYQSASTIFGFSVPFITPMRATPTVSKAGTWIVTNCDQPTAYAETSGSFLVYSTSTVAGNCGFNSSSIPTAYVTADIEL